MARLLILFLLLASSATAKPTYVRKASRVETVVASLKASGLPALEGPWHILGPFDYQNFEQVDPPEEEIDLKRTYTGKASATISWKEMKDFALGKIVNLKRYDANANASVFLLHQFETPEAMDLPISLGSDDTLKVWLDGKLLVEDASVRGAAPDQNEATLALRPGKHNLLIKVGNIDGEWSVYLRPELPKSWPAAMRQQLDQDFHVAVQYGGESATEAKYYRIVTLPVPQGVSLEVGGLAMRPDGRLFCCTRRGDIWLIDKPNADDPDQVKYKLFASGLHEPLGLHLSGKELFVVQRPELTKLVDKNGDDVADSFVTVCDKFGVSGDYHEFAFGPARDKQGNFYLTLNVGFGGGHQSKAPWRGWCVKITPKGELIPFATGLRSPNGVRMSPDGDLFYCDNQGEWVATNKMHHIKEGDDFGHQAGLRWVKQSPFAKTLKEGRPSGMLYDGQKGTSDEGGFPQHTPPTIWFPYGRMGQSASEMIWDTTGGKFGPFAGQCFVGDLTQSKIMRVHLEKVKGRFQGACFPFRSGFQSGVNRLEYGPDASLYVGQTNRGWGSTGGKAFGLQRLVWTEVTPFEMHAMKLTKTGFDVTFTKPLDPATAKQDAFSLTSHTYNYWPTYGSPEVDRRGEKILDAQVSADRKTVSLKADGLKRGRVYSLFLEDILSADKDKLLHSEAYYTLNELP